MINRSSKGRRNEYRSIKLLEAMGYSCIRSAASKGIFDVIGLSGTDIVALQVKTNAWPGSLEMEQLKLAVVPPNCRKLIHLWKDRVSMPVVKKL